MVQDDFGEELADVRERLSAPLPVRIISWHVFLAVTLETFARGAIVVLARDHQTVTDLTTWLPKPSSDLQEVVDSFEGLKQLQPTSMQMQQANDVFLDQMERRCDRYNVELTRWWRVATAAVFLGNLIILLCGVSTILSALSVSYRISLIIAISQVLAQISIALIWIKGWHRCAFRL